MLLKVNVLDGMNGNAALSDIHIYMNSVLVGKTNSYGFIEIETVTDSVSLIVDPTSKHGFENYNIFEIEYPPNSDEITLIVDNTEEEFNMVITVLDGRYGDVPIIGAAVEVVANGDTNTYTTNSSGVATATVAVSGLITISVDPTGVSGYSSFNKPSITYTPNHPSIEFQIDDSLTTDPNLGLGEQRSCPLPN